MATRATRSPSRAGPAAFSPPGWAAATDIPPPQNPAAPVAPGLSTNLKRAAVGVTAPRSAAGIDDDGAIAAKRRRTAVSSDTAPEPAADAAVLKQRIADLETDNARLCTENAWLRKRPRLPEPPAALQQLVTALGARERDLRDTLFQLVCRPQFLAKSASDLHW